MPNMKLDDYLAALRASATPRPSTKTQVRVERPDASSLLITGGDVDAAMAHPKVEWLNMVAGAHMQVPCEQWIKDGFLHWLPIIGVRDEAVTELQNIAD